MNHQDLVNHQDLINRRTGRSHQRLFYECVLRRAAIKLIQDYLCKTRERCSQGHTKRVLLVDEVPGRDAIGSIAHLERLFTTAQEYEH